MPTSKEGPEQVRESHQTSVSNTQRAHQHVEIASLISYTKTIHNTPESGDGSIFVLEGPAHVIDQLVDFDQQKFHNQDGYGSPEISQSKTNPLIEGVVDLAAISHLVTGVTEEEFVDLLQQDVAHPQHEYHEREKHRKEVDEESELLLKQRTTKEDASYVVTPPDRFVNDTGDFHQDLSPEYTELSSMSDVKTSLHHSTYPNGAEEFMEAYLLLIPPKEDRDLISNHDSNSISENNDMFVLAVPEIVKDVEYTQSFRISAVSNGTRRTKVEELQSMIDRAFAPLPTDVQNVELRVSTAKSTDCARPLHAGEELHLDLVVDRNVPLIGYIILIGGLFALSSIGAAFDLQGGGVAPEMKAFWRFTSTAAVFLLLSAKSLTKKEFEKFTWTEFWILVPFAGVNYGFMCTAFVMALEMTSLVNAFILSNLASLIIIGSKYVMGLSVLFLEGIGAVIGLTGALICAFSGSNASEPEDENSNIAILGNILAFFASVSTAVYLSIAKSLRPRVDLFVFMLFIFCYAAAAVLAYISFTGKPYEVSMDPTIGLFGWLNSQFDRLPLELWMAIVCNGFGTTGYIAIMKYFDPVVISMVMLMEPIIASLMGFATGVSNLPGLVTWAGDGVVVLGSVLVILSGSQKTEIIDATETFHTVNKEFVLESEPCYLRHSSLTTKTPTLKQSVVLRSHDKVTRANTGNDSMEFVFVGKSRGNTHMSSLRVSTHKNAWN